MPELIKTRWYPESVLKAYYRFESGALTTDSSGEGHTLTAISDPAEDASGKWGGAVALDGNDAYSHADHADFKPTGAFTIGMWVKPASFAATVALFNSISVATNYAGIYVSNNITTGTISFLIGKNTGTTANTDFKNVASNGGLTAGQWNHVVLTWDTQYMRIYINGALDIETASTMAPAYAATNYVRIGCRKFSASAEVSFFNGSLDDVFLLNGKALTAYEVLSIYRTISPGAFLMNLASNWKNN